MGDSLDGSGEPSPESQNVAIVEYPTFASYLRKAVTVLLPDEDVVPPAFSLALDDRYNQDCIRKFLGDSQVSSLYVQRSSSKGKVRDRSVIISSFSFSSGMTRTGRCEAPPLSNTLTCRVQRYIRTYMCIHDFIGRRILQNQSRHVHAPLSRQI